VAVQTIRFGVLDVETRRSAAEVGGWGNAARMGVSCAVLYTAAEDAFTSYGQDEMEALVAALGNLDLVVGFNLRRFDYTVLSGCCRFDFRSLPTLDMLEVVHARLGYRLSLEHLAKATLGAGKSADGLQALAWWKEGRVEEIRAYCARDVAVTRDLYLYGRDNGHLLFTNKAGSTVRLPVDWDKAAPVEQGGRKR
jgi:DEAD/DEAH box helicase domain-containing protein